ncbi:murein L,D-transpeptidase catalytic domain family protein [Legionella londiniensis]|uniref:Murein L,D-transpeptidase catalytic domain family protein n=1 Tax=Legionella londiniensis TaxID=45068 RepID=A0A0W0VQR8_9GAMM|nr:murein L,D-transpeptidase catalytic domain family protein [Legionella londiniensis]KTD22494.1 hypothetical protein Llon_0534 [Legionella londiniensis]STX93353.1 Uncharacterised protein [Legionella londiniensis]
MNRIRPWVLAYFLGHMSLPVQGSTVFPYTPSPFPFISQEQIKAHEEIHSIREIQFMLNKESHSMSQDLIDTIITILKCAQKYDISYNPILTVIDYSKPASQRRLWIFDLNHKKLLLHTYVSHGIKSGILSSRYFSNRHNSKASSIGVYKTENDYYGRYGYALRLIGLESGFNDNAFSRAVVMHGGWYVNENFVEKYKRPGRSWGCPAVPREHTRFIINTIKDNSLLIAYYPSENWYMKSKYINCNNFSPVPKTANLQTELNEPEENRDEILFLEKNNNNQREENEPILVISADNYQKVFNREVPLKRMLRRPLNNQEFVALNLDELQQIITHYPEKITPPGKEHQREVLFIVPVIKKVRGYYATEMQIVPLGEIKEIKSNMSPDAAGSPTEFTVHFQQKPSLKVKSTDQFIRWLGL